MTRDEIDDTPIFSDSADHLEAARGVCGWVLALWCAWLPVYLVAKAITMAIFS